jgi:hypothetical protein
MKVDVKTSKRGHEYRVIRGKVTDVSVFQTTGKVRVRWPHCDRPPPWPKQQCKEFGPQSMVKAFEFARRIADGDET